MGNTDAYSADSSVPIGDVARVYGVSLATVRAWDRAGKIVSFRTPGGQRRFRLADNPELAALLVGSTS